MFSRHVNNIINTWIIPGPPSDEMSQDCTTIGFQCCFYALIRSSMECGAIRGTGITSNLLKGSAVQ